MKVLSPVAIADRLYGYRSGTVTHLGRRVEQQSSPISSGRRVATERVDLPRIYRDSSLERVMHDAGTHA